MQQYEYIAPCHFGLEAVLKKEILALGYEIVKVEDGKVTFRGGIDAICRANIFLRTTERILLKVAEFSAATFDELFEATKSLPWENYIPADGRFWVAKAASVKSKLFSPSDIQSIMKKAIVDRLKSHYHISWFEETGISLPIRVTLLKDVVTVGIDTSGNSLHKRGYRPDSVDAPISETLAAALIMLTPWNKGRILVDPFCGSGTIPIEAAMIGANIAPGINRSFNAEDWQHLIPRQAWYDAITEANDSILHDISMDIQGYDIDRNAIKISLANARLAEVAPYIHFQQRSISELSHRKKYGFIITNPPYGERLNDKDAMPALYREIGQAFKRLDSWSLYIITGYDEAQHYIGKKADKNRKIYNGMIKTYFYQFMGPKPPKRKEL